MHKYIGRRILLLLPVLIGVSFIVFSMMYITPGDPAAIILGEQAADREIQMLREQMGLNDPFIVQYGRFARGVFTQLDFGRSWTTRAMFLMKSSTGFQHLNPGSDGGAGGRAHRNTCGNYLGDKAVLHI